MQKTRLYTKHILSFFVLFFILAGLLVVFRGKVTDFVINPLNYVNSSLTSNQIYSNLVFVLLIVISFFISLVIYLISIYKTRFDIEILSGGKSLILSKSQLRELYENAPVPYLMLDENAEIYDSNKSALRFFGVFPEEIDGKNFFSYLSGEDKEQAERFFQFYKANVPINRREVEIVTKKEGVRFVELSIFELKEPGTFSRAGLVMIFDITEQKRLDRAKTEFVSLASHQLKSPLATTKWFTEMLMSGDLGELSPKQAEYIEKLHVANENMVDLVDVLLNVSRIEMGSLVIDLKLTNVEELSESILQELAFLITKKNIKIEKQYNGLLQNIKSDPKLLRIVVQNLISNAVKYTPENGTVSVSFEENSKENKIIVTDTGYGIPKEQQSRIFTKLFRADNIRSVKDSQGTGLGLYLARSIINSIGGDISFTSEENKGSTFIITLKK